MPISVGTGDRYTTLRDEMTQFRNNLPRILLGILNKRAEKMKQISNEILKIVPDISYNLVDVAGTKVLAPNVQSKPPTRYYIQYTGKLGKLERPHAFVPEEGLEVILPPVFMFDEQQFIKTIKQMSSTTVIGLVYGISSLDAPYNGDFQNAVKKIYYSKEVVEEYDAVTESIEPPWRSELGEFIFKLKQDDTEKIVYINWLMPGTKCIKYRLSDSNVYIYHAYGRYIINNYETGGQEQPIIYGHVLVFKYDDYVKVMYGKRHMYHPYGVLILETPEDVYEVYGVTFPKGTDIGTVNTYLGLAQHIAMPYIEKALRIAGEVLGLPLRLRLPFFYPILGK